MNAPVGIIGSGAWGTALAYTFSKRIPVILYCHEEKRLPRVRRFFRKKSPQTQVTNHINAVFDKCNVLVLAIPFQAISNWFSIHGRVYDLKKHIFINASKGVSADSLQFFSQIIPEGMTYGVLSGPSFAEEVISNEPTLLVFASLNADLCRDFQTSLSHEVLRIYVQHDPLGVCVGGALKNVLAIASGVAHGLGLKKNAISGLITRGVWEIASIAKSLGADPTTIFGLSGLGDILLSCYSTKSRNMSFGQLIGKGIPIQKALKRIDSTVEGYPTTRAIYQRLKLENVEAPIVEEMFLILYKQKAPSESIKDLMDRPLKTESFPFKP